MLQEIEAISTEGLVGLVVVHQVLPVAHQVLPVAHRNIVNRIK